MENTKVAYSILFVYQQNVTKEKNVEVILALFLRLKKPKVFKCLNLLRIMKQIVLGLVLETIVDVYVGVVQIFPVNLFMKFVSKILTTASHCVIQETIADILKNVIREAVAPYVKIELTFWDDEGLRGEILNV